MQLTKWLICISLFFMALNSHAQTVTVEEGKQYTNKAQSKGNLDNLMQDIQDMIDDITAKRNDFNGDIRDLENKIISITPPTCSGANNKPTWDSSTWTCTSDNIGTFLTEANWQTSAWGACSATCGGGTQTRSITCPTNSICSGTKPTNTQSCNTQACAGVWNVSDWGACAGSCGSSTQARTVTCSTSICSDPKPATTQSCDPDTDPDAGKVCLYKMSYPESYTFTTHTGGKVNVHGFYWKKQTVYSNSQYTYSRGTCPRKRMGTMVWYSVCRKPK